MKKLLCIILITLCLFSFASCKKDENNTPTDTHPSDTVEVNGTTAPTTEASTGTVAENITAADSSTTTTWSHTVSLTFPEGYTIKEIAELLEKEQVCPAKDFIDLANNITYLQGLNYTFIDGITEPEKRPFVLEGYVFPDTYEFYRGGGAEDSLRRFLDNTEHKLTAEYKQKAEALGYTMDEIITLASIIQEESSEHEHMANVSSVLHNRVEDTSYGRVECDVTINYIRNNITDSPYISADPESVSALYDTYECYGLPLGAICNPGIHAIEAALEPADTNYYFFVTDADMNYYFSETYEEHLIRCEEAGL